MTEQRTITTQRELRQAFWRDHPQHSIAYRATKRQNDYKADVRMAWVDYVDNMQRGGEISESLASRATL